MPKTKTVFALSIREMWVEYIIVYLLIFFVITKLAQKLAFRIVDPKTDKPIFVILTIQCFTVCLIVPSITLFATFFHNGFTAEGFQMLAVFLIKLTFVVYIHCLFY